MSEILVTKTSTQSFLTARVFAGESNLFLLIDTVPSHLMLCCTPSPGLNFLGQWKMKKMTTVTENNSRRGSKWNQGGILIRILSVFSIFIFFWPGSDVLTRMSWHWHLVDDVIWGFPCKVSVVKVWLAVREENSISETVRKTVEEMKNSASYYRYDPFAKRDMQAKWGTAWIWRQRPRACLLFDQNHSGPVGSNSIKGCYSVEAILIGHQFH